MQMAGGGVRVSRRMYQFAAELLVPLEAQKFKTLDFHWAESDAGTDTEHNVIVVTGRGQPFEQGLMLDNWRHAGHLLWGPLDGDPSHAWQENKNEYNRRLNMARPAAAEGSKQETKAKTK